MRIEKTGLGTWIIEPHTSSEAIGLDAIIEILEKAYGDKAQSVSMETASAQSSSDVVTDEMIEKYIFARWHNLLHKLAQ